ncbi:VanZ family protein [Vagococcus elongatus]|uniref:VanZ-like domain-containing protein n=1 Tax=Vagococcus elongatus TaxID=180344 RepID=A0A430APV5_9ENTE|nr:VanZ family protein [Vagococcus elongatus]RSU10161.1 hypothetical protein CBF29_10255 [Vagococcus elongatus]
MSAYIEPVKIAIISFPFVALLLSLPILVYHYHKYGIFLKWFAVVIYSFILYLLAAYFLVILPLPDIKQVAQSTLPTYNIQPFAFVREFIAHTVWRPFDLSTYFSALKQPVVIQPLFNVFLTLPFGVYLRYGFKRNLKQTVILSFLLSLFFELTQLSGLYGIYPRPYRLFDVDDLFLNTLGGVIGYWLTPFFRLFFPSDSKIEMTLKDKSKHQVTYLRRLVAFIVDWVLMSWILDLAHSLFGFFFSNNLMTVLFVIVYYYFVPLTLFKGQTIGKKIVNLKIISEDGQEISKTALLKRQSLFGVNCFLLFYLLPRILSATGTVPDEQLDTYYYLALLFMSYALLFTVHIIVNMLFKKKQLIYEKVSHTYQISTK